MHIKLHSLGYTALEWAKDEPVDVLVIIYMTDFWVSFSRLEYSIGAGL
jgi:hypothetical protein